MHTYNVSMLLLTLLVQLENLRRWSLQDLRHHQCRRRRLRCQRLHRLCRLRRLRRLHLPAQVQDHVTWQDMTSCPASCISCQLRSTEIRKNLKLISRDCIHCTSAGYLLGAIHFGKLKMLKDIFMYCDSLCVTFPQSWMRSFAGLDAIPAKSFTLSAKLESDWADKGLWSTFLTSCVFKGALQS